MNTQINAAVQIRKATIVAPIAALPRSSEKASAINIADSEESELFRAGQSFYVPGNSRFKIEADEVVDYVCHLGG